MREEQKFTFQLTKQQQDQRQKGYENHLLGIPAEDTPTTAPSRISTRNATKRDETNQPIITRYNNHKKDTPAEEFYNKRNHIFQDNGTPRPGFEIEAQLFEQDARITQLAHQRRSGGMGEQTFLFEAFGKDFLKEQGYDLDNPSWWFRRAQAGDYSSPLDSTDVLSTALQEARSRYTDWQALSTLDSATSAFQDITSLTGLKDYKSSKEKTITADEFQKLYADQLANVQDSKEHAQRLLDAYLSGTATSFDPIIKDQKGKPLYYLHQDGRMYALQDDNNPLGLTQAEAVYKDDKVTLDRIDVQGGDGIIGSFAKGLTSSIYDIVQIGATLGGLAKDAILDPLTGKGLNLDSALNTYQAMGRFKNTGILRGMFVGDTYDPDASIEDAGDFARTAGSVAGYIAGTVLVALATGGTSAVAQASAKTAGQAGAKVVAGEAAEAAIKEGIKTTAKVAVADAAAVAGEKAAARSGLAAFTGKAFKNLVTKPLLGVTKVSTGYLTGGRPLTTTFARGLIMDNVQIVGAFAAKDLFEFNAIGLAQNEANEAMGLETKSTKDIFNSALKATAFNAGVSFFLRGGFESEGAAQRLTAMVGKTEMAFSAGTKKAITETAAGRFLANHYTLGRASSIVADLTENVLTTAVSAKQMQTGNMDNWQDMLKDPQVAMQLSMMSMMSFNTGRADFAHPAMDLGRVRQGVLNTLDEKINSSSDPQQKQTIQTIRDNFYQASDPALSGEDIDQGAAIIKALDAEELYKTPTISAAIAKTVKETKAEYNKERYQLNLAVAEAGAKKYEAFTQDAAHGRAKDWLANKWYNSGMQKSVDFINKTQGTKITIEEMNEFFNKRTDAKVIEDKIQNVKTYATPASVVKSDAFKDKSIAAPSHGLGVYYAVEDGQGGIDVDLDTAAVNMVQAHRALSKRYGGQPVIDFVEDQAGNRVPGLYHIADVNPLSTVQSLGKLSEVASHGKNMFSIARNYDNVRTATTDEDLLNSFKTFVGGIDDTISEDGMLDVFGDYINSFYESGAVNSRQAMNLARVTNARGLSHRLSSTRSFMDSFQKLKTASTPEHQQRAVADMNDMLANPETGAQLREDLVGDGWFKPEQLDSVTNIKNDANFQKAVEATLGLKGQEETLRIDSQGSETDQKIIDILLSKLNSKVKVPRSIFDKVDSPEVSAEKFTAYLKGQVQVTDPDTLASAAKDFQAELINNKKLLPSTVASRVIRKHNLYNSFTASLSDDIDALRQLQAGDEKYNDTRNLVYVDAAALRTKTLLDIEESLENEFTVHAVNDMYDSNSISKKLLGYNANVKRELGKVTRATYGQARVRQFDLNRTEDKEALIDLYIGLGFDEGAVAGLINNAASADLPGLVRVNAGTNVYNIGKGKLGLGSIDTKADNVKAEDRVRKGSPVAVMHSALTPVENIVREDTVLSFGEDFIYTKVNSDESKVVTGRGTPTNFEMVKQGKDTKGVQKAQAQIAVLVTNSPEDVPLKNALLLEKAFDNLSDKSFIVNESDLKTNKLLWTTTPIGDGLVVISKFNKETAKSMMAEKNQVKLSDFIPVAEYNPLNKNVLETSGISTEARANILEQSPMSVVMSTTAHGFEDVSKAGWMDSNIDVLSYKVGKYNIDNINGKKAKDIVEILTKDAEKNHTARQILNYIKDQMAITKQADNDLPKATIAMVNDNVRKLLVDSLYTEDVNIKDLTGKINAELKKDSTIDTGNVKSLNKLKTVVSEEDVEGLITYSRNLADSYSETIALSMPEVSELNRLKTMLIASGSNGSNYKLSTKFIAELTPTMLNELKRLGVNTKELETRLDNFRTLFGLEDTTDRVNSIKETIVSNISVGESKRISLDETTLEDIAIGNFSDKMARKVSLAAQRIKLSNLADLDEDSSMTKQLANFVEDADMNDNAYATTKGSITIDNIDSRQSLAAYSLRITNIYKNVQEMLMGSGEQSIESDKLVDLAMKIDAASSGTDYVRSPHTNLVINDAGDVVFSFSSKTKMSGEEDINNFLAKTIQEVNGFDSAKYVIRTTKNSLLDTAGEELKVVRLDDNLKGALKQRAFNEALKDLTYDERKAIQDPEKVSDPTFRDKINKSISQYLFTSVDDIDDVKNSITKLESLGFNKEVSKELFIRRLGHLQSGTSRASETDMTFTNFLVANGVTDEYKVNPHVRKQLDLLEFGVSSETIDKKFHNDINVERNTIAIDEDIDKAAKRYFANNQVFDYKKYSEAILTDTKRNKFTKEEAKQLMLGYIKHSDDARVLQAWAQKGKSIDTSKHATVDDMVIKLQDGTELTADEIKARPKVTLDIEFIKNDQGVEVPFQIGIHKDGVKTNYFMDNGMAEISPDSTHLKEIIKSMDKTSDSKDFVAAVEAFNNSKERTKAGEFRKILDEALGEDGLLVTFNGKRADIGRRTDGGIIDGVLLRYLKDNANAKEADKINSLVDRHLDVYDDLTIDKYIATGGKVGRKLSDLKEVFGIKGNSHDAAEDARITAEVLDKLLDQRFSTANIKRSLYNTLKDIYSESGIKVKAEDAISEVDGILKANKSKLRVQLDEYDASPERVGAAINLINAHTAKEYSRIVSKDIDAQVRKLERSNADALKFFDNKDNSFYMKAITYLKENVFQEDNTYDIIERVNNKLKNIYGTEFGDSKSLIDNTITKILSGDVDSLNSNLTDIVRGYANTATESDIAKAKPNAKALLEDLNSFSEKSIRDELIAANVANKVIAPVVETIKGLPGLNTLGEDVVDRLINDNAMFYTSIDGAQPEAFINNRVTIDSKLQTQLRELTADDVFSHIETSNLYSLATQARVGHEFTDMNGVKRKLNSSTILVSKGMFDKMFANGGYESIKERDGSFYVSLVRYPDDKINTIHTYKVHVASDSELNGAQVLFTKESMLAKHSGDFDGDHVSFIMPKAEHKELLKKVTELENKAYNELDKVLDGLEFTHSRDLEVYNKKVLAMYNDTELTDFIDEALIKLDKTPEVYDELRDAFITKYGSDMDSEHQKTLADNLFIKKLSRDGEPNTFFATHPKYYDKNLKLKSRSVTDKIFSSIATTFSDVYTGMMQKEMMYHTRQSGTDAFLYVPIRLTGSTKEALNLLDVKDFNKRINKLDPSIKETVEKLIAAKFDRGTSLEIGLKLFEDQSRTAGGYADIINALPKSDYIDKVRNIVALKESLKDKYELGSLPFGGSQEEASAMKMYVNGIINKETNNQDSLTPQQMVDAGIAPEVAVVYVNVPGEDKIIMPKGHGLNSFYVEERKLLGNVHLGQELKDGSVVKKIIGDKMLVMHTKELDGESKIAPVGSNTFKSPVTVGGTLESIAAEYKVDTSTIPTDVPVMFIVGEVNPAKSPGLIVKDLKDNVFRTHISLLEEEAANTKQLKTKSVNRLQGINNSQSLGGLMLFGDTFFKLENGEMVFDNEELVSLNKQLDSIRSPKSSMVSSANNYNTLRASMLYTALGDKRGAVASVQNPMMADTYQADGLIMSLTKRLLGDDFFQRVEPDRWGETIAKKLVPSGNEKQLGIVTRLFSNELRNKYFEFNPTNWKNPADTPITKGKNNLSSATASAEYAPADMFNAQATFGAKTDRDGNKIMSMDRGRMVSQLEFLNYILDNKIPVKDIQEGTKSKLLPMSKAYSGDISSKFYRPVEVKDSARVMLDAKEFAQDNPKAGTAITAASILRGTSLLGTPSDIHNLSNQFILNPESYRLGGLADTTGSRRSVHALRTANYIKTALDNDTKQGFLLGLDGKDSVEINTSPKMISVDEKGRLAYNYEQDKVLADIDKVTQVTQDIKRTPIRYRIAEDKAVEVSLNSFKETEVNRDILSTDLKTLADELPETRDMYADIYESNTRIKKEIFGSPFSELRKNELVAGEHLDEVFKLDLFEPDGIKKDSGYKMQFGTAITESFVKDIRSMFYTLETPLQHLNKAVKRSGDAEGFKRFTNIASAYYGALNANNKQLHEKVLAQQFGMTVEQAGREIQKYAQSNGEVFTHYRNAVDNMQKLIDEYNTLSGNQLEVFSIFNPHLPKNRDEKIRAAGFALNKIFNPQKYSSFDASNLNYNFFDGFINMSTDLIKSVSAYKFGDKLKKIGAVDNIKVINPILDSFTDYVNNTNNPLNVRNLEDSLIDQEVVLGSIHNDIPEFRLDIMNKEQDVTKKYLLALDHLTELEEVFTPKGLDGKGLMELINLDGKSSIEETAIEKLRLIKEGKINIMRMFLNANPELQKELDNTLMSIRSGDQFELVDSVGRIIHQHKTENGHMNYVKQSSQTAFDNLKDSLYYSNSLVEAALNGDVFVMSKQQAKFLDDQFYTVKAGSGLHEFLVKSQKLATDFIMGAPLNPLKTVSRLVTYTLSDLGLMSSTAPSALRKVPQAIIDTLQLFQSNGKAVANEDLMTFVKLVGKSVNVGKAKDLEFHEYEQGTGIKPLDNWMRIIENSFDTQTFATRYTLWLAVKESFDQGKPLYGGALHKKDYIDALENNAKKAMYIVENTMGGPGGFPLLAKKVRGYTAFVTYPLGIIRHTKDWTQTIAYATRKMLKGELSSNDFRSLYVPGMGVAGMALLSTYLISAMSDAYGLNEEDKEENVKNNYIVDPVMTLTTGRLSFYPGVSLSPYQLLIDNFAKPFNSDNKSYGDKALSFASANGLSFLNPVFKIPMELITGKDMFGESVTDVKSKYSTTENLARKFASFAIGGAGANSLVNNYKLTAYEDNLKDDWALRLGASFGRAMQDELYNSKGFKKDSKNFYNMQKLVNAFYYDNKTPYDYEKDLFEVEEFGYMTKSGTYDRRDATALKDKLRLAISQKAKPSTVINIVEEAIGNGTSKTSARSALNAVSLARRLSMIQDKNGFYNSLTEQQEDNLKAAIAYEDKYFGDLQRMLPDEVSKKYLPEYYLPYVKTPYIPKVYPKTYYSKKTYPKKFYDPNLRHNYDKPMFKLDRKLPIGDNKFGYKKPKSKKLFVPNLSSTTGKKAKVNTVAMKFRGNKFSKYKVYRNNKIKRAPKNVQKYHSNKQPSMKGS